MTAICHLVGLDEIHKLNLLKQIPNEIIIVDLDIIQTKVQKKPNIIKQKNLWSKITTKIVNIKKKHNILYGFNNLSKNTIGDLKVQIKRQMAIRNVSKIDLHKLWKVEMHKEIDKQIKNIKNYYLFVGFNIYPKDYRIKIDLNVQTISNFNNYIVFDIHPKLYAANQIKYYLHAYTTNIIDGKFPLKLLETKYLSEKYNKIINYYSKKKYILKNKNEIINYVSNILTNFKNESKQKNIIKLDKVDLPGGSVFTHGSNLTDTNITTNNNSLIVFNSNSRISNHTNINKYSNQIVFDTNNIQQINLNENTNNALQINLNKYTDTNVVYVPTMFKTGKTIPVNKTTPITGYFTKQEAIDAVKAKIKNNRPIYIHKSTIKNFDMVEGKLISKLPIDALDEESILVSSSL